MWIAITVGALVAAALTVAAVEYFMAFYNPNKKDVTYDVLSGPDYDIFHDDMIKLIDDVVDIPYETVEIRAFDGKRLFARFYAGNDGAPFHLECHGYKGNGIRDFSGGMQLALEKGDNILLIDHRAHGRSEGHTISFGILERRDVLLWTDYLIRRFGGDIKIYLEGVSMGAATVLMASELQLPPNVVGILADCPYSSPFGIVKKVTAEMVPCPGVFYPFFPVAARLFGRFRLRECSAVEAVKHAKVPILLIHGTGDHYVPFEMSREIKAANPDLITLVEVEGAPHGLSFIKDNDKYRAATEEFRERTL
ncbi:MAG: alpha/beta hydrolase [Clostridia bacterium]|nr:alpha/beta hydrolase [Clostridia bacterium]